ncbi:hypothetical protein [Flexivirga sp. B27]
MTGQPDADDGVANDAESAKPATGKAESNGEQLALGCGGVLCLMVGLVLAMLAPAIGDLSGMTDSPTDASFSARQPIPLAAHRTVRFDLDAPADDGMQRCTVTGPDHFSFSDPFVQAHGKFTTTSEGNYYISCDGSTVTVRNDAGGHPAVDIQEGHGKTNERVLFALAGFCFVLGILAFIGCGRSGTRKTAVDVDGSRAG